MAYFIGVDIGKQYFDASIDGQANTKRFDNDEKGFEAFLKWIAPLKERHVAMEATGNYSMPLAVFLYEKNINVSIINPAQIKYYAQAQLKRVKTDPEDAKVIADFCKTQSPKLWQPSRDLVVRLQQWLGFKQLLEQQKVQLQNQMNSHMDEELKQIQAQQLRELKQQIKQVDKRLKTWVKADKALNRDISLLETIDGIGTNSAMDMLASIEDIGRFDKAKQLACYAGLTPRIRRSGTSINSSSISKTGNHKLRKALYMPAIAALRFNPVIKCFAQRLKANGVRGKKMVVAVMRKLIHIVFAVLKNGKPFDREYEVRA